MNARPEGLAFVLPRGTDAAHLRAARIGCVPNVTVTLIGKPDCHLCDVAGEVIAGVVGDGVVSGSLVGDGVVGDRGGGGRSRAVTVEKLSILDDEVLHERYWEQIPVVLVNGVEHAHWHVDPESLRSAILEG